MLYLEDYIELIEHLPSDLRERFTDMREMDLQVGGSRLAPATVGTVVTSSGLMLLPLWFVGVCVLGQDT